MYINEKDEKKSRSQFHMDTNSNIVTKQFNSRSTNASTSSCKLINSIKEKQKKLLIQQSSDFIHEKKSDNDIIYNNRISRHKINRKELTEMDGKEEADVKINAGNVWCKDMTSSAKESRYCKDTDGIDLQQDSYSTIPCSSFRTCDNTKRPQSWISIYPSETRTKLDDNDDFLSRAICTIVERRNYYKNNDRNNVRGDDNKYTVCHMVDDTWLPKSSYTNCVTYNEDSKERFADSCKYQNKILQESVINRNDIRKRQVGYKLLQQSLGSCQREQVTRKWSTCSCIAEEEEDYCIDRVEKELPGKAGLENMCDVVECLEKISVCRTPRKLAENAAVYETLLSAPEKYLEKTCKDSERHMFGKAKRSEDICGTEFKNSKEPSKITRVCKEFVTEGTSEDITVCKTIFGEPSGLAEEVIVCRTASPDSKATPKETICKKIPNSNFANQDEVNRLSLNNIQDKLMEENINSSNTNGPQENTENKRIVKVNKHDNDHSVNDLTRQQSTNVKQYRQIKKTLNENLRQIPVDSIKDFKPLPKNDYSTTLRPQLYNHSNHVPNSNVKKTSKTLVNQQRIRSLNQSMRNYSQRSNNLTQNLMSNKNNQLKDKSQENSKKEEERQDISKEMESIEDKQKESRLRPFKKLIDVIRRGRMLVTDRIETGKIEEKKTIADKKDDEKLEITFETKDKTEDKTSDIKDQQEIIKKVATPMKTPQTEIANKEKFLQEYAPVTDFVIPKKGKKMDIQRTDQMPKLLRIIAMKKSHVLPTAITTDSKPQESEIIFVPAEIITATHVDQEKIPEEKVILQEHTPAEITQEIKADDSIAPEVNVVAIETSVEDIPKDIIDEDRVSKEIRDETTKILVTCPLKKPERESQKLILCKCGLPPDPNARSCSIAKCTKDVPCPQKKSEEEPQKFTLCKRELAFNSNNYSCSIVKCTKCNNIIEDCKDNRFERKKIYCAHCHLSTMRCTCAAYLKNYLKIDKPKFHDVSSLNISSHICTNCCKSREKRRKTTICYHSPEECRCIKRDDCSRNKCGSQVSCINCGRPRNQYCATFALVKCHKEGNCKRTMICLYCDNPQDKCICRAPIGKCSYCGPSDVCNCQDDEGHARDYKQVVKRPNENRTIHQLDHVSWKPKREIRRYFARNFEDFRSYSTEECQCYEKPKQQRREELPYQRLNIFSEVMNELQQKSESVCCARCWRNPCCCGSLVDQDKKKKERKAENHVKCAKIERSLRNKSLDNCECSPNPRNECKNIVQKSIPIRLAPCRCRKDKFNRKRPLAKCYYCKNLPCTCIRVIETAQVR